MGANFINEFIRVLLLTTLGFTVAMALTPAWAAVLYRLHLGKQIRGSALAPVFSKLHQHKAGTPTMGGVLIWGVTALLVFLFAVLAKVQPELFGRFNFLNRAQTLLPLGALLATAVVGLFDDLVDSYSHKGGGLTMGRRLAIYTTIAVVGAYWFYFKLGWTQLHVPFVGDFDIGLWYVPFFIFVIVGTAFSVNEIDGLDGLAGGTLLTAFAAYGVIAFTLGRYDLATFCAVIVGALLAFLWFNIPPARFFMGDTGAMSLGVTLGIIALLTNYALLLPIIGLLFVVESLSFFIQVTAKKFFGRKVFISAPIHHHLEAIGWPESKIVMRFWVIAGVTASLGVALFLVDQQWVVAPNKKSPPSVGAIPLWPPDGGASTVKVP